MTAYVCDGMLATGGDPVEKSAELVLDLLPENPPRNGEFCWIADPLHALINLGEHPATNNPGSRRSGLVNYPRLSARPPEVTKP